MLSKSSKVNAVSFLSHAFVASYRWRMSVHLKLPRFPSRNSRGLRNGYYLQILSAKTVNFRKFGCLLFQLKYHYFQLLIPLEFTIPFYGSGPNGRLTARSESQEAVPRYHYHSQISYLMHMLKCYLAITAFSWYK